MRFLSYRAVQVETYTSVVALITQVEVSSFDVIELETVERKHD